MTVQVERLEEAGPATVWLTQRHPASEASRSIRRSIDRGDASASESTLGPYGEQVGAGRIVTRTEKGDERPVGREPGSWSSVHPADKKPAVACRRIADIDVAAGLVCHESVPAGPNGGGHARLRADVGQCRDDDHAMRTSATAIGRHVGARRNARERVMSAMGSHLSGKLQAGRCRMRPVRPKTSSR